MDFDDAIDFLIQRPIMNGWEITRMLGRGKYGVVYEIKRQALSGVEEYAALKWIRILPSPTEIVDGESAKGIIGAQLLKERYMSKKDDCVREIQLMYQLKGESTIVSYDSSDAFVHVDGIGWNILIRMERLMPLKDYLCTVPVTINNVLDIGSSIAEALSVCHSKGIIHGDVKIQNCYHFRDNVFKLGDFGLSVPLEHDDKNVAGTAGYLSPECVNGATKTELSDQYALGIMLSTLLSGKLSPTSAANVNSKPVYCPREIWRIIERATQTNPEDRYPSLLAMKHEIDAIRSRTFAADFLPFSSKNEATASDTALSQTTASNVLQNKIVAAYDAEQLAGISAFEESSEMPPLKPEAEEEKISDSLQQTREKQKKADHSKQIKQIIVVVSCVFVIVSIILLFMRHKSSQSIGNMSFSYSSGKTVLSWTGGTAPYTLRIMYNNSVIDQIDAVTENYSSMELCPGEMYVAQIVDRNGSMCSTQINIAGSDIEYPEDSFHIDSAYVYSYTIRDGEDLGKARDKTVVNDIVIRSNDLQTDGKGFYLRIGYTSEESLQAQYYLLCGKTIERKELHLEQTPVDTTYYFTLPLTDKLITAGDNDIVKLKMYSQDHELLYQTEFEIRREGERR